jgi:hypothetical protein
VTELERRAFAWIRPFRNARHLERTRDWVLVLRPEADEALRLAALTHDAEREMDGGAPLDAQIGAFDDPETVRAHCERSARVVGEWLRRQGASEDVVTGVASLVLLHETGGTPDADLLQAADSLSFLETNPAARWVRERRASPERAAAKLRAMHGRMRLERARELARPYLERALGELAEGGSPLDRRATY